MSSSDEPVREKEIWVDETELRDFIAGQTIDGMPLDYWRGVRDCAAVIYELTPKSEENKRLRENLAKILEQAEALQSVWFRRRFDVGP